MNSLFSWIRKEWADSSPLRHAVGAFLAVELSPYLTQIYEWAVHNQPLPDWQLALHNLGKAIVGGVILFILRAIQKPKAPEAQPTSDL